MKLNYATLRDRCERISRMVRERAIRECRKAGLGDNIEVIHNAIVSLHYGKPWQEVDYKHAKRANWIIEKQFDAYRVLDRLYKRKGPDSFDWR